MQFPVPSAPQSHSSAGVLGRLSVQKKAEAMKKPGSQLEARQKALTISCPICKVGSTSRQASAAQQGCVCHLYTPTALQ